MKTFISLTMETIWIRFKRAGTNVTPSGNFIGGHLPLLSSTVAILESCLSLPKPTVHVGKAWWQWEVFAENLGWKKELGKRKLLNTSFASASRIEEGG